MDMENSKWYISGKGVFHLEFLVWRSQGPWPLYSHFLSPLVLCSQLLEAAQVNMDLNL